MTESKQKERREINKNCPYHTSKRGEEKGSKKKEENLPERRTRFFFRKKAPCGRQTGSPIEGGKTRLYFTRRKRKDAIRREESSLQEEGRFFERNPSTEG